MESCCCLLLPVDKFQSVSEATGYPAAWFFVVACLVLTGILTLVGGAKLLVDLLGFVYPAYMSFKSMDTNAGDDTQWLTYWIVFSFLSIVETMLSFLTALIPMYFWLKVAIIIVRILLYSIVCIAVVAAIVDVDVADEIHHRRWLSLALLFILYLHFLTITHHHHHHHTFGATRCCIFCCCHFSGCGIHPPAEPKPFTIKYYDPF